MRAPGTWIAAILIGTHFAMAAEPSPKTKMDSGVRIHMVVVQSSVIRALGYNKRHKILDVLLLKGRRYRYYAVPAAEAEAFRASESKGKFYNERIKKHFRFVRLR